MSDICIEKNNYIVIYICDIGKKLILVFRIED